MAGIEAVDGAADRQTDPQRRANVIEGYRQAKARLFQKWIKDDPALLAQTFIDPLGTLSRHGMIEPGDREVSLQITQGSLVDVIRLREAAATHGLARLGPVGPHRPGADLVCGSIYVDGLYWGDGCIELSWWQTVGLD
jgi:hypothetical protein